MYAAAVELYQAAMVMMNATRPDKPAALVLLHQAAELGHSQARARIAWAQLLGAHLPQNLSGAVDTFLELANIGQADSQMVRIWEQLCI